MPDHSVSGVKLFFLSLQHFLVMYAGAVVVPIVLGRALSLSTSDISFLISADLLTSGIATLLYIIKTPFIGVGLPVVLGASFNSLSTFIIIGKTDGLPSVYGAIIVSGLFIFLLAPLLGKMIKKLPRIILGIVVAVIGLSLIPFGFEKIIPPANVSVFIKHVHITLFLITLLGIFFFQHLAPLRLRNLSVIVCLVFFSFVYYIFSPISLSIVEQTSWFSIPHFFYFGLPTFHWNAIIPMILILLVTSIESAGDLTALSEICQKPLDKETLSNSFRSEGLATLLGGFFNAFTYSNFAQNIGLVQLTGVKKISVIAGTAILLIFFSFFPKIATLTTLIPEPVLGATMLTMFGMITANGIRILSEVNFKDHTSIWTLALSLGFGIGISHTPGIINIFPASLSPLIANPILMSTATALFTYYTLFFMKKRGL